MHYTQCLRRWRMTAPERRAVSFNRIGQWRRRSSAQTHTLEPFTIPAHTSGCTRPFHGLRLASSGPTAIDAVMEDAEGGTSSGGGGGGSAAVELGAADRLMIEELVFMLIHAFSASHKDCAKLLAGLAEELALDVRPYSQRSCSLSPYTPSAEASADVLRDRINRSMQVINAISAVSRLRSQQSIRAFGRLDVELADRLADWLGYHVSHFNFSLEPFEATLGDTSIKTEDAASSLATHARFIRCAHERMTRLSYLERVSRELPTVFKPLLPPKPAGLLAWEDVREGDLDAGSAANLSANLIGKLRNKLPNEDVTAWVDRELGGHPLKMELVVQTLLHAGAKSVSHLEKLFG